MKTGTPCIQMSLVFICLGLMFIGCGDARDGQRADGRASITYWRTLTGAAGDAQDALVERFNDEHDTVYVSSEFQGSYSDLAAKLVTAAAAGRGPNVTQLGTFEIRQFAQSDLLVDLRPFIEGENGLDTSDWPGTMLDAGNVDGGIYWLPFNVTVPVLYYNIEAFEEAGIDGPPETWDEFFDYAERLTKRDSNGRVTRHGVALWRITWPYVSMIWSEGGELTDRDYNEVTLNDPVAVRMLTQVQWLVRDRRATAPDTASGGHRAAFQSGQAAMILDSPAAFRELVEGARGFTTGVATYPAGAAGRVFAPGGGGLAMLSYTTPEKRDAAWAFIKHMLSAESLAEFASESGYLAFTEGAQKVAPDLMEDERHARLHAALPYVRGDFSVTMSPAVRNAFDEAYQSIVINLTDVQETLDAANARAIEGVGREQARRSAVAR